MNLLTDAGGIPLVQALEENSHLRHLVLFGTLLGDGTAWAASAALQHNTTLETFIFYGKQLSHRGIGAFSRLAREGAARLQEFVVGGTDFRDEDTAELAHAVISGCTLRAESSTGEGAAKVPLRKFGILNALLGDESARAAAELLFAHGLEEVSLAFGKATDDGAVVLGRALAGLAQAELGARTEDSTMQPSSLRFLRVACGSSGDMAIAAFESAWTKQGMPLELLDIAFGSASAEACAKLNACSVASGASSSSSAPPPRRRVAAINNFGTYLDEVMFPQLFMRSDESRDQ